MNGLAENQMDIFDILDTPVDSKEPDEPNARIKELESKYIFAKPDFMTDEELQEFLAYNESTADAPYRDRRIQELQKHTKRRKEAKAAQLQREEAWMALAREYVELTKKWESLGAFHVSDKSVKWFYNGEVFYQWLGMPSVEDELPKAKAADERLMQIVNAESAHYSKVKNPDMRYLEEKHFDDKISNPNFVSYLLANDKQVGDPYRLSHAQKWIDEQVIAFKESHGRNEHDMLNEIEDWPSKLRIYLREVSKK